MIEWLFTPDRFLRLSIQDNDLMSLVESSPSEFARWLDATFHTDSDSDCVSQHDDVSKTESSDLDTISTNEYYYDEDLWHQVTRAIAHIDRESASK